MARRGGAAALVSEPPTPLETTVAALDDLPDLITAVLWAGMALVRGWRSDEGAFVALSRRAGPLERASPRDVQHEGQLFRVKSRPGDASTVGGYWHADGFAGPRLPPVLTIYHVAEGASPRSGTSFVDGFLAWRHLPDRLRTKLRGRQWKHLSGVLHPFALKHPVHGQTALSVNLGKIVAVTGSSEDETRHIVTELERLLDVLPRYVHPWREGDILFVDNRRLLHRAPARVEADRLLWRTSVVCLHRTDRASND